MRQGLSPIYLIRRYLACFEVDTNYQVVCPEDCLADAITFTNTAKECQQLCYQKEGCAVFIWKTKAHQNYKQCRLLAGVRKRIYKHGVIAGPPMCHGKRRVFILIFK